MSKGMAEELKGMVGMDENIMYEGRPDKKCFILEGIFNPMLFFALVWLGIDSSVLIGFFSQGVPEGEILTFIIPFFLLHLMPVWIYLFGALMVIRKYNNTYYIVTDRAVYISKGIFVRSLSTKTYAECSNVNLHRGILDQICGAGDVVVTTNQRNAKGVPIPMIIGSIKNYQQVYNMVMSLQRDVYSDIMYPNAMRPKVNPGYHTKYTNTDDFSQ